MIFVNYLFLLLLSILIIFNRGGAAVGFGNINAVSLLLALMPIYFVKSLKIINLKTDISLLLFVITSVSIAFFKVILTDIDASNVREIGILLYPAVIFAGIFFTEYKKKIFSIFKYLNFIFLIATINFLISPVIKKLFINFIIINNVSLLGYYGSYSFLTISAFCWFSSGLGSLFINRKLLLLSAASSLISGSRAAVIGLFIAFLGTLDKSFKKLLNFKNVQNIFFGITILSAIVFLIFPIFVGLDVNIRGDYSPQYFLASIKSIFNPFANMEEYGTSLLGSRQHRIIMALQAYFTLISKPSYFLFGMPFDLNYTGTSFNDPHNSYVSLFARGGIITLLTFLYSIIVFLKSLKIKSQLLILNKINSFSFSFILFSIFYIGLHPVLTSPMTGIPFYFLYGFIWALNSPRTKKMLTS